LLNEHEPRATVAATQRPARCASFAIPRTTGGGEGGGGEGCGGEGGGEGGGGEVGGGEGGGGEGDAVCTAAGIAAAFAASVTPAV